MCYIVVLCLLSTKLSFNIIILNSYLELDAKLLFVKMPSKNKGYHFIILSSEIQRLLFYQIFTLSHSTIWTITRYYRFQIVGKKGSLLTCIILFL